MQTVRKRARRTGSRAGADLAARLRLPDRAGKGAFEQVQAAGGLAGEVGVAVGELDRAVGDHAALALAIAHGVTRDAAKQGHDLGPARLGALQPRHPLAQRRIEVERQRLEEQRALVAERAIEAAPPEAGRLLQLVERGAVEALGVEHLQRPAQHLLLVELAWSRHIGLISCSTEMEFRTACSRTASSSIWRSGWSSGAGRRSACPSCSKGFCAQLGEAGLDLWRVLLGLETLHPELSGTMLLWQEGALEKVTTQRAGILTSECYLRSPTRIVDETGQPFRWRAGESTREMPRLEAYQAEGVTDYLMLPLPFLDTTRTAVIAYATRAPGGFREPEIALLDAAARLLSPWAERALLRKIALDLLTAYLGAEAGRRVYDGQIERGDLRTIRAAIWFCDLRGFTALSDRLPRAKLIKVLNRWFEAMGGAIADGGGEILKFMGDGLLAVFPVDGDPAATCDRARRRRRRLRMAQTRALAEQLVRRAASSRCAAAWPCISATSSSAISARRPGSTSR